MKKDKCKHEYILIDKKHFIHDIGSYLHEYIYILCCKNCGKMITRKLEKELND